MLVADRMFKFIYQLVFAFRCISKYGMKENMEI